MLLLLLLLEALGDRGEGVHPEGSIRKGEREKESYPKWAARDGSEKERGEGEEVAKPHLSFKFLRERERGTVLATVDSEEEEEEGPMVEEGEVQGPATAEVEADEERERESEFLSE